MTSLIKAPTIEELEYLKQVPSAWVRDSTNKLNIKGCVMNGLLPLNPFGAKNKHIAGPALTVQLLPRRGTVLKSYNMYSDIIPFSKSGDVLVIAGNGMLSWAAGENQINHSIQYGLIAWVTDLCMRDVTDIRETNFPVFCKGVTPEHFYQDIVAINVPVFLAGAHIRPGDIIIGDNDGVVSIPIEAFEQVMRNIRYIEETEGRQEQLIKDKVPPEEIVSFLASRAKPV